MSLTLKSNKSCSKKLDAKLKDNNLSGSNKLPLIVEDPLII